MPMTEAEAEAVMHAAFAALRGRMLRDRIRRAQAVMPQLTGDVMMECLTYIRRQQSELAAVEGR
jgi:hypothetical protein